MLVNLVPEFLAVLAAPDRGAAYHEYFERHKPVLTSYWHNYVLEPESPHAEQVIAAALGAGRTDLQRLLEDVDVIALADDALRRALERFEADCAVDLYLMVGVGAANAGELVVDGRGVAFVCLEHFTGRANAQTSGLGLAPHLLPLWIAHEVAHAVRYTSPTSRAELRRLIADFGGRYDYWDTGSRATLRELLVNEGAAVAVPRLHAASVPPDPRARRLPPARRGTRPRRDRPRAAAAVSLRGPHACGAAHGRQGPPRTLRLLPWLATRRDLRCRARRRIHAAGGGGRVPAGRRPRARHPDRMSPRAPLERRQNRPLREVLDDLIAHARDTARRSKEMTPAELDYAQQRLEWLADEVWRLAAGGGGDAG